MTPSFHPAADWPGALPATAQCLAASEMQAARQQAYRHVAQALPVAAVVHSVRGWLKAAPAELLLRDCMHCAVATDCWVARRVSPRGGFADGAWRGYFAIRLQGARAQLAPALARWAVLERIPSNWIPHARVQAELLSGLAAAGFEARVTALQLAAPTRGGAEWVANECGADIAMLTARAQSAPVAALLHWPERTAAAVVVAEGSQLKAFGRAFAADGHAFDSAGLAGCTVLAPQLPPSSWAERCVGALGLDDIAWRWIRRRRIRLGANPLAQI